LSEIQARSAIPSVALSGNKNRIIIRVERLLKQKKMKTNVSEKIVAGLLILGSATLLTFSTGASPDTMQNNPGASPKFNLQVFEKDSGVEAEDQEATLPSEPDLQMESDLQEESDINSEPDLQGEPDITSEPELPAEPEVADESGLADEEAVWEELLLAADLSLPGEPNSAWTIHKGDTASGPSRMKMDVKDNVVSRNFINKDGEETNMKFTIREGKVKELYINGDKVPESDFPKHEKEIKRTLDDLKDMEADLQKAKQELENFDYEKIQADIQAEMERFREEDMVKLQDELARLQKNQFDVQIDHEAIQNEMEEAMQEFILNKEEIQKELIKAQEEARIAMEEFESGEHGLSEKEMREMQLEIAEAMEQLEAINQDKLLENLEKELKAIREIDAEKIQKDIELALKEIDFEKMEREMARAMKNLEKEGFQIDKEKLQLANELKSLDELLEELEKLDLEEK